jgi:putative transposase
MKIDVTALPPPLSHPHHPHPPDVETVQPPASPLVTITPVAATAPTTWHRSPREFWSDAAQVLADMLPLPERNAAAVTDNIFHHKQPVWFEAKHTNIPATVADSNYAHGTCNVLLQGDLPNRVIPPMPEPSERAPDKPPAGKARKVRLYPTKAQRKVLNDWFKAAQWTYNTCLRKIKEDPSNNRKRGVLRAYCVNGNAPGFQPGGEFEKEGASWVLKTPSKMRQVAMDDVLNAYKSNIAKQKKQQARIAAGERVKNRLTSFEVKERDQYTQASQSICITAGDGWSAEKRVPYKTFFKTAPLKASEKLPADLVYDTRLMRDRLGKFYLCLLSPLEVQVFDPCRHQTGILALDPGVRTFLTGYDPRGEVYEFGKEDFKRLTNLCHRYDQLPTEWRNKHGECTKPRRRKKGRKKGRKKSSSSSSSSSSRPPRKNNHRHRCHLKRAGRRLQERIRNLVEEVHRKTVKHLVTHYDTILLPKFETSQMVLKKETLRKITSKTARAMLTWAHYRFRTRLINKVREYPWCRVVVCNEAYTSKTCGACGFVHHDLEGEKVFCCPQCGVIMDRDMNAARNILIRYLVRME